MTSEYEDSLEDLKEHAWPEDSAEVLDQHFKTITRALRIVAALEMGPTEKMAKAGIATFNAVPTDDIHNTQAIKAEFTAMYERLKEEVSET